MTAIRDVVLLMALFGQVAVEKPLRPLLDFAGSDAAQKWQAVNDNVMGGVSDGRFRITSDKTLEFSGRLSLENNGGFASLRTKPAELEINAGDTIVVRVKGDGREYVLNLYTKSRRMALHTGPRCQPRKTSGRRCRCRWTSSSLRRLAGGSKAWGQSSRTRSIASASCSVTSNLGRSSWRWAG
jgi:hypothetical protein